MIFFLVFKKKVVSLHRGKGITPTDQAGSWYKKQ